MDKKLSTEAYKGVRDFYPEDMAIQSYIFNSWQKTAELFGFERYEASILEPADLYKSKGTANEEIVTEQTYSFIDRGEREVTLRPEMTPTVARMVAGRQRTLRFPLRWYSIPNLFRYERPQRGRLREHWQLNCDIFGADDYIADVEIISLACQILIDFGATPDMFEVKINNRSDMSTYYDSIGIKDVSKQTKITRLNDRFRKISSEEYLSELENILGDRQIAEVVQSKVSTSVNPVDNEVISGLKALGITNVKIDYSLARGFDYYTDTIFEIFDISGENNRSLLGGGRYSNLTSMFTDKKISGTGFGMGDVTMKDFLFTHKLIPSSIQNTTAKVVIIPTDEKLNLEATMVAQAIRKRGISVSTDIGTKKIGKKIAEAVDRGITYSIVVGTDEINSSKFTLKNLVLSTEIKGNIHDILTYLIANQ